MSVAPPSRESDTQSGSPASVATTDLALYLLLLLAVYGAPVGFDHGVAPAGVAMMNGVLGTSGLGMVPAFRAASWAIWGTGVAGVVLFIARRHHHSQNWLALVATLLAAMQVAFASIVQSYADQSPSIHLRLSAFTIPAPLLAGIIVARRLPAILRSLRALDGQS